MNRGAEQMLGGILKEMNLAMLDLCQLISAARSHDQKIYLERQDIFMSQHDKINVMLIF